MSRLPIKVNMDRAGNSDATVRPRAMPAFRPVIHSPQHLTRILRSSTEAAVRPNRVLFALIIIARCITAIAVATLAADLQVVVAIGVSV